VSQPFEAPPPTSKKKLKIQTRFTLYRACGIKFYYCKFQDVSHIEIPYLHKKESSEMLRTKNPD